MVSGTNMHTMQASIIMSRGVWQMRPLQMHAACSEFICPIKIVSDPCEWGWLWKMPNCQTQLVYVCFLCVVRWSLATLNAGQWCDSASTIVCTIQIILYYGLAAMYACIFRLWNVTRAWARSDWHLHYWLPIINQPSTCQMHCAQRTRA